MRILLSTQFFPPSVGGVEKQSAILARGMARRGHDVHVVTSRLDGTSEREVIDGVTIERVPTGSGSRYARMATYLAASARAAMKIEFDLLHVQQLLYPATLMSLVARFRGRPIVARNAGSGAFGAVRTMPRLPLGSACLKVIARTATVVSLTDAMTRELHDAGFPRVELIPNGVDVGEHSRGSGRSVLYVGRLDREKGVDVLLDAWQSLSRDATLTIAGDGPDAALLRARSADVAWLGNVSDPRALYIDADVFVLPSRSEGTSNALLEAMAAGVACVATDVDGNRALVTHDVDGVLTPSGDAQAMADAIEALLDDPARRRRLGDAARAKIARERSVETMLDRYEALYLRLVGGG